MQTRDGLLSRAKDEQVALSKVNTLKTGRRYHFALVVPCADMRTSPETEQHALDDAAKLDTSVSMFFLC